MQRRLVVRGHVQGVFYRDGCQRQAEVLGVRGWARNCDDGSVEVVMDGDAPALDALEQWCRVGPSRALVSSVESRPSAVENLPASVPSPMTLALVTGAASGLGHGLVDRLVARGDDVVAVDVEPVTGVRSFVCDVSDRAALERVRDEVGPVDLLFNNAGVAGTDAARIVAVNLGGVINGCELFLPATRVVNTASLLGVRPSPRRAAYSASKAGVIVYSLALHDAGVAVSIVLPHVRSQIERDDPDGPEAAYVAMGADPLEAAADVLAGVDAGKLWIVAGADPGPILAQVSHFPQ